MYNEQYQPSPMEAMRSSYSLHHSGYGQGGKGYGEQVDFMGEIREMAHGRKPIPDELKAVVCAITKEQTDRMLGQYGYTQSGHSGEHSGVHDSEHHHRYKEALEELRDIPNVTEAVKRAGQYFDDLTDEDRKVLQQILNRPSYKKMAQMVNLSPDRFMEVKRELERKLKR